MSRPPTPAEIRLTNPNMTMQCSKCYLVMNANADYGTFENMLTINMYGGYGEYVDSAFLKDEELEFYLCHKCAHKLMKTFFGDWDWCVNKVKAFRVVGCPMYSMIISCKSYNITFGSLVV